jgi:hypothetical protein
MKSSKKGIISTLIVFFPLAECMLKNILQRQSLLRRSDAMLWRSLDFVIMIHQIEN